MHIAVVVPVMKRPEHAERFMATLSKSDAGPVTVYPVADAGDKRTIRAWQAAGATVLISDRGSSFACKAQYGYLNTTEPWILLVGSDVVFHADWYSQAVRVEQANQWASMIATNDTCNPHVLRGLGATHPIIRRSWVDEKGASLDGPGHITHEGYPHICDPEWYAVASVRDKVFVYAPDCVIEHMHPTWGKAKMDDVYLRGRRSLLADRRLWEKRGREAGLL